MACASPLASNCSRAYSWIISSSTKRGSPPEVSFCRTRLLSTRDASPSNASIVRPAPQTASIASRDRPPRNTARRPNNVFSSSSSRSKLQFNVCHNVRWRRGASRAPPPRVRKGEVSVAPPNRSSKACGVRNLERAAASSMASGIPSSRAQIRAIVGALELFTGNPGSVILAC